MEVHFLLGILYLLWVTIPLIPAVLTYWLFPSTAVAVSGPLAGLTVNASGAFAGYLVVFLATYPLVNTMKENAVGVPRQFWTVSGQIKLIDANEREPKSADLLKKFRVETVPDPWFREHNYVTSKVLEREGKLPLLKLIVEDFGEYILDLRATSDAMKVSRISRTIEMKRPIEIREIPRPQARADSGSTESASAAR